MKAKVLIIALLVLATTGLGFFVWGRSGPEEIPNPAFAKPILPGEYSLIFDDLKKHIDDLSPTPPTEEDWIIQNVEFVKNSNLTYITYHDTHNIFRILVEVGKQGKEYQVKATFEKEGSGWQKTHGEDSGIGRETVIINN